MDHFDYCLGCDGHETLIKEDHSHQYFNMRGAATTCWWFEGICYTKLDDLLDYVRQTLECGMNEALDFVNSLPKKYN